jgi:hypothetical protein
MAVRLGEKAITGKRFCATALPHAHAAHFTRRAAIWPAFGLFCSAAIHNKSVNKISINILNMLTFL